MPARSRPEKEGDRPPCTDPSWCVSWRCHDGDVLRRRGRCDAEIRLVFRGTGSPPRPGVDGGRVSFGAPLRSREADSFRCLSWSKPLSVSPLRSCVLCPRGSGARRRRDQRIQGGSSRRGGPRTPLLTRATEPFDAGGPVPFTMGSVRGRGTSWAPVRLSCRRAVRVGRLACLATCVTNSSMERPPRRPTPAAWTGCVLGRVDPSWSTAPGD